jgi:uncharacterized membrane protein
MNRITKTLATIFVAVNILAVGYWTVVLFGPVVHVEYHEYISP